MSDHAHQFELTSFDQRAHTAVVKCGCGEEREIRTVKSEDEFRKDIETYNAAGDD